MSKGTISNLKPGFVTFELKGLDEYMETLLNAGKNIDEVVAEALQLAAEPLHASIHEWASKHRLTGAVISGIIPIQVERDGNEIYVEIGITGDNESWHAVFTEYGSPKNIPADPGIRRTFDKHKGEVAKIIKRILRDAGVPVDG